jgi:hypothetical protein
LFKMSRRPKFMPEPRLWDREQSAFYCGLSVTTFDRHCPVQPRRFGTRKLWDRVEIDAWLSQGLTGEEFNAGWRKWIYADASAPSEPNPWDEVFEPKPPARK